MRRVYCGDMWYTGVRRGRYGCLLNLFGWLAVAGPEENNKMRFGSAWMADGGVRCAAERRAAGGRWRGSDPIANTPAQIYMRPLHERAHAHSHVHEIKVFLVQKVKYFNTSDEKFTF